VHILDVVLACIAAILIVALATILARQRQMLRATGALPLAIQRGNRWLYGIGRYAGGELRWYRTLGIGTRPSLVFRQGAVEVVRRREPRRDEQAFLPGQVVIIDCRTGGETLSLAIGESAYTGFVSWLESSAPRS
jgi:hypothetical protein